MNDYFMREALRQAKIAAEKDEVPIGAVIVHSNKIIAKAHNQVETLKDPTAHAEMIAVTQAANTLGQKWLTDCTLFVTIEPCSMCAGALVLARIKKIIFGALDPKAGACGSILNIASSFQLNHRIEVESGLMGEECAALIQQFFQKKRQLSN
ncbi:MAG: tRNA adenosine(34) deaminase TadA [Candidatus Omnitrophota bacterium]|nr:tRNA adenosine(34) deaminase TadA [Candidatus Omnitrophota bacterium]